MFIKCCTTHVLTFQQIKHFGDDLKKVIAYIRKLSGCNALAQSLYQLICRATVITQIQRVTLLLTIQLQVNITGSCRRFNFYFTFQVAIVEGLYFLFRELLPSPTKRYGDKIIEDGDVFESAAVCWAFLLSQGAVSTFTVSVLLYICTDLIFRRKLAGHKFGGSP